MYLSSLLSLWLVAYCLISLAQHKRQAGNATSLPVPSTVTCNVRYIVGTDPGTLLLWVIDKTRRLSIHSLSHTVCSIDCF